MIPVMRSRANRPTPISQINTAAIQDVTRVRAGDDCYAGFELDSDGTVDEISSLGTNNYTGGGGTWLNSGLASSVWVERTIIGGSPGTLNSDDPGTGRLNLGTTRAYSCVEVTATQTHTVQVTFDFYDAASGGNLIASKTVTFSAEEETP